MQKKWVIYKRVSSKTHQRIDGLGIAAQTDSIKAYIDRTGGEVIGEFSEAESGSINERPQLTAAIEMAKKHDAVILTAKLDRISRDACFLLSLRKNNVQFLCVDMPEADFLQIGIYAMIAQKERELIALRTKMALQAAKNRGVKLGNPNHKESVELMVAGAMKAKMAFRKKMLPIIEEIRNTGCTSLTGIAQCLNRRGLKTRNEKEWYPATVRLVLSTDGVF